MRIALAVVLALAACTHAPAPKPAQYASAGQAKPKGVMRCQRDADTGSNYAERICTYEEPKEGGGSNPILDNELDRMSRRSSQHEGPNVGGNN